MLGVGAVGLFAGLLTSALPPAPATVQASTRAPTDAVLASGAGAALPLEAPADRPTISPDASPLRGLPGAATALAVRDYDRALALLDELPAPDEGSETWFWVGALRGRALRGRGRVREAVEVLEPRWEHRKLAHHFPRDLLGLELAKAKVQWAREGGLPTGEADAQRRQAVEILGKTKRVEPVRTYAPMRVLQAETMAELEGTSGHAAKVAARKALKAVDKILHDYPYHPRIGDLWVTRALLLERAGKAKDAASELREIAISRAGEPEADRAWSELERVVAEHPGLRLRPLSPLEKLEQAQAARGLRRVELSREILDGLIDDPDVAGGYRAQAVRSRSYTAYKQRDFARCADDLRPLWKETGNVDVRDMLLRCLERGAFYDEAIEMWVDQAKTKRRGTKAHALWEALDLAVRGGRYARAEELLAAYEKHAKGHRQSRAWLHAWLPYRLGRIDEAIDAFEEVERFRSDRVRARYFRGKLLLRSDDPEQRDLGAELLSDLARREALDYYGLIARQRLLDAGLEAPPVPKLIPMADEPLPPTRAETQALLDELDARFGSAWPPIRRARQLYAAGWIEEARREVRVAVEAYLTGGKRPRGPRNESIIVGLGWKPQWKHPRVAPTKKGRKTLRDRDDREALREGLRTVARAVEEPYRHIRLTEPDEASYAARWHPRAYRAAVEREARLRGIDPVHMWSLMYTESRFRRFVVSPVGARGALQIMPWTARQLAERLGECESGRFDDDSLFDIDTNAHLSGYYVAELLAKFHGQAPMAYASYNGGPSNVSRWLAAKAGSPEPLELDAFIEEIPFRETNRYTRRVMEVSAVYGLLYGDGLPRWTNAVDPEFEDNIDF